VDPTGPLAPAELRTALHHLPLAVGLVDGQGAVRYVNPEAERLYGFAAGEVIGQPALALGVAPSDTAAAAELLSTLSVGETWRGQFPLLRSDGSRLAAWVIVSSIAVLEDEEPWLAVLAIPVADLAEDPPEELRTAQARAEEANLLLQGVVDAVPVGMAFWDRALRFVRVNDAMAAFNGLPAADHVGHTLTELLETLPEGVTEDIMNVFATGRTSPQREVVGRSPADSDVERTWLVSYYPVVRGGDVLWVGAIALEVTEWRQGERERARLLEAERSARRAAELSAERLARLQIVTGRLAEASDRDTVAEIVVRHGTLGVGASAGALCMASGEVLELCKSAGMREESLAGFDRIPLDADLPITEAFRTREMVLLGSVAERDERYPALAGIDAPNQSFAAVPMVVEGHAIGAIVFSWPEERHFDDGESQFLLALGRQAAQALERARLYEAERDARAAAEEAGERMRFLAEASRVLSSSLDYEVTLAELARLAVPEVGDLCMVHLIDGSDLRLVVAAHRRPDRGELLASVASGPVRDREPRLLGRAAALGESVVLSSVPDELLQRVAEDEHQLEILRALELRSGVVVPLQVQDRILGVLSLAADSSSTRTFGADDLPFVEDLAGRAAVAVENSRTHRARSEVAQTLQRSLLPPNLPHIDGLELAQRYHSMGDVEVGGDFFDVFPAGDGRWGVVMGDVCGKGVAAASLTALARYTVRAGAIEGEPAGVLRLLNRAILDSDVGERFCTIAHALVEATDAEVRVVLACGGHPLPLLLTADGEVRAVGTPGTAIGLFEDIELTEVELTLHAGDALVLYTDGFTEARSPAGGFDPELLGRTLATATGRSAEGIAEVLDREVLAFEQGEQRDDMALLVLRVPPRP
jgi:PAS domain S-box-containing protein